MAKMETDSEMEIDDEQEQMDLIGELNNDCCHYVSSINVDKKYNDKFCELYYEEVWIIPYINPIIAFSIVEKCKENISIKIYIKKYQPDIEDHCIHIYSSLVHKINTWPIIFNCAVLFDFKTEQSLN